MQLFPFGATLAQNFDTLCAFIPNCITKSGFAFVGAKRTEVPTYFSNFRYRVWIIYSSHQLAIGQKKSIKRNLPSIKTPLQGLGFVLKDCHMRWSVIWHDQNKIVVNNRDLPPLVNTSTSQPRSINSLRIQNNGQSRKKFAALQDFRRYSGSLFFVT